MVSRGRGLVLFLENGLACKPGELGELVGGAMEEHRER